MKKIAYSLFAAAFVALSGCQDDVVVEEPVVPAQTGDEITFGSSLEDTGVDTRTEYGELDPTGKFYPVTWEKDGSDQIAIYCPQASNGTLVKYAVSPQDPSQMYDEGVYGDPSRSETVTKVNPDEAGLQWGEGIGENGTHHFYGFYPASAVTGTEDGKIRGTIPVVQDPVEWVETQNTEGGITYTGVANTDYAFMWAYGEQDKTQGGDVALTFHPWVTILDIEIKGPSQNSQKMSAVQIRSLNNTTLTGDFICDMTPVEQNTGSAPTYTAVDMGSEVRNQITIRLYDQAKNDYITLEPNDKIVVRAYLLPKDYNYDTGDGSQQLQIRVTPYNRGVLTRTLDGQNGQVKDGIVAHKVNTVKLPALNESGANYWMSSLDPGIYVTELSLPGSKMSALTRANNSLIIYQDDDIATQFTNGIRAFIFQTGYRNDDYWDGWNHVNDYNLYVGVQSNRVGRLNTYIKQIADGLAAAQAAGKTNEYAFVLLSWSSAASDNSIFGGPSGSTWINAVEEEIKEMAADDSYRIFTEEITPETTIADVSGKIIFKVNYNDIDMANSMGVNANVPALFALWGADEEGETNIYATNDLRWGSSNQWVTPQLRWFYQEVTTVGDGAEASLVAKKNYIVDMWNKSIENYNNNEDHSMWFMNDLGGSMGNGLTETSEGVDDLTAEIGPFATEYLFDRGTVNATLGIVYLNHATPNNSYSGNLIQTIINNNFSFQLRTSTPQSSEIYSIPTRTSSNGWDE